MALPELLDLPSSVSLRAVEASDRAFLLDLFLETSGDQFAQLGLPPEQLRGLLEMQFRAREEGWRGQYPDGLFQVVIFEADPVGYLALGEMEGGIALIYLGLLKKFQGRGIASGLLRNLQDEAAKISRKICAHVEVGNPALGFWKHRKFKVLADMGPYLGIEWCPE